MRGSRKYGNESLGFINLGSVLDEQISPLLHQVSSYYGPCRTDAFYLSQLEAEWGNGRITPRILNLASGWGQDLGVEAEF